MEFYKDKFIQVIESIKECYFEPGDKLEQSIEKYVIDIVRGGELIEIQTNNFSTIKQKLQHLLKSYKVRLVYPIHSIKWIVKLDKNNMKKLSRRK